MASQVTVKEYQDPVEFERDAAKMAKQGWEVQSTTERTQRSGCMRILLTGGLGAFVFKPAPKIVVTYRKAK